MELSRVLKVILRLLFHAGIVLFVVSAEVCVLIALVDVELVSGGSVEYTALSRV